MLGARDLASSPTGKKADSSATNHHEYGAEFGFISVPGEEYGDVTKRKMTNIVFKS